MMLRTLKFVFATAALTATGVVGHVKDKIIDGAPIRGTNLGGWLVSEHWMTATAKFWDLVPEDKRDDGEYQAIASSSDPEAVRKGMEEWHRTFITEKDIKEIAEAGLNTVRVPVGYWLTQEDKHDPSRKEEWKMFPKDNVEMVDKLMNWTATHNIAVLFSIHAAKGSQNGMEHSAAVSSNIYWDKYTENVKNTIDLAVFIAERYKDAESFLGIGLLNEPTGDLDNDVLFQYYKDAYKAVRETGSDCILVIMPKLIDDVSCMNGFMDEASGYERVFVEQHLYPGLFGNCDGCNGEQVIGSVSDMGDMIDTWNTKNTNRLFIGEWSLADGLSLTPEESDKFTKAKMKMLQKATGGWTLWSWHSTGDDILDYTNGWSMYSIANTKANYRSEILQEDY